MVKNPKLHLLDFNQVTSCDFLKTARNGFCNANMDSTFVQIYRIVNHEFNYSGI